MKPVVFWKPLAARLRNLHPASRRRTRLAAPFDQVTAATGELNTAMQAVETGFLAIGSILETTTGINQALVAQSARLVALAEGPEGGTQIIGDAVAHIGRALDFAAASAGKIDTLVDQLTETSRQIRATLPTQQALTDALNPLKYVQILFRVESASLAPEVQSIFFALNAEIARICQRVESGFQEKFALIASIDQRLNEVVVHLRERQGKTRELLAALQSQLEQSLSSVKAEYAHNQARDNQLGQIALEVKRDTGAVVFSLQAQDMLNQKLQHLRSILGEMRARYDALPGDQNGDCRTLRFIEQAGQLVAAQLDVMKGELRDAGTQVGGGLKKILHKLSGLNEAFALVEQTQAGEITIDGSVQNLVESLENVGHLLLASQELVVGAHRILEPIRSMSTDFTRFMRDLTLDIQLIGLNAEVQSAHVASGTGLEVVSARTSEVSLATCRLSDQLAIAIDRISQNLVGVIESFGLIRSETEYYAGQMTAESTDDENRLHGYRDRMIDVLLQIAEQLPQLQTQAQLAMDHADFSGAALRQIEALQGAVGQLQTSAAATADAEGVHIETAGMTDQFLTGYTMRSQVDVHQRALAAQSVVGTGATPAAPAGADVELFGFENLPPEAAPLVAASPAGDVDLWGDEPVVAPPAQEIPRQEAA